MLSNFAQALLGAGLLFSTFRKQLLCTLIYFGALNFSAQAGGVIILVDDLIGFTPGNSATFYLKEGLQNSNFVLDPNPSTNQLTVRVAPSLDLQAIEIYSLTGDLKLKITLFTFPTYAVLDPGTYILKIKTKKGYLAQLWVLME